MNRYLADEIHKKAVIVYNHPRAVKPFNVRCNDDGKTCAAFDVIVPKVKSEIMIKNTIIHQLNSIFSIQIGTLIRGSQSEERLMVLSARINELGLEKKQYEWYLDLRRHGAVKSSGFAFMFDPFILYSTGLNDIRDATPFPRSFGQPLNN